MESTYLSGQWVLQLSLGVGSKVLPRHLPEVEVRVEAGVLGLNTGVQRCNAGEDKSQALAKPYIIFRGHTAARGPSR